MQYWDVDTMTRFNINVARVKVYPRQTWNFRPHAVSKPQADACTSQAYACMYYMHCPMASKADACTYCMGSVVLILSGIYLYSSYFGLISLRQHFFKKSLTFSRTILMLPFKAALVGGFRSRKMENLIVRAITVFRVSVLRVAPQHFCHSHFPEQPLHLWKDSFKSPIFSAHACTNCHKVCK